MGTVNPGYFRLNGATFQQTSTQMVVDIKNHDDINLFNWLLKTKTE